MSYSKYTNKYKLFYKKYNFTNQAVKHKGINYNSVFPLGFTYKPMRNENYFLLLHSYYINKTSNELRIR